MSDPARSNCPPTAGTPEISYGFRLLEDGRTIEIHSEEQSVIRLVARMKRKRKSYKAIAKQLNAMGIAMREGKPWDAKSLRWAMTDDRFDFSVYGLASLGKFG